MVQTECIVNITTYNDVSMDFMIKLFFSNKSTVKLVRTSVTVNWEP